MKAERNYSVDLLKCISMLMVVVLHLNNYGLRNVAYNHFGLIGLSSTLLQSFSIVGVNVFVLITGYFLSGSRVEFSKKGLLGRYKRLLPLWIQVELYSVGVYLVLCAIPQSGVRFGFRQLIKQALPLMTSQYWFFTVYFLLIIVSPFLNRIILNVNQREYRNMLIVLFFIFSLLPSISVFGNSFGTEYGYSLLWFAFLYSIGGYIRVFDVREREYGLIYLALVFLFFLSGVLSNVLPKPIPSFLSLLTGRYTSVFVLAASVSIFLLFLKSKHEFKRSGKAIALVSSLSFAVYLIHEHNEFRLILWEKIIGLGRYADNPVICFIVMIVSVIGIYAAGIIIEFLRMRLSELIKLLSLRLFRRKG